jgi:chromosomal replication initiation ATPase DnaA
VSRWKILLNEVAAVHELTPGDITGRSRVRKIVRARQRFCLLARDDLGLSLCEIGRRLQRDHTTVLHSCRRAASMGEGAAGSL